MQYIAAQLIRLHAHGLNWHEVCLACHSKYLAERIANYLDSRGIPVARHISTGEKRAFDSRADTVKVMTMHSSKGLEFSFVVIPGVDALPRKQDEVTVDAKLLYVAMTRSTDKLLLTASGNSQFVERLARARDSGA